MSFWPDDINADEIRSPRDIMEEAGEELDLRTGKLTVSIQESQLEDRVVLAFEVTRRESKVIVNLFEASHRPDQPYPVVINPPAPDIPEFLLKERYVGGKLSMAATLEQVTRGMAGKFVENEWVCTTPFEFKHKLTELFSMDYVTVRIISLLASVRSQEASDADAGDTGEDPTGAEHAQDT